MRSSRIKAKLARNEPVLITLLHLTDPSVYEMASLIGIDGLWMDLEHHAYSVETANQLMCAARVGTSDIIARPAKGEFMRMCRLLEAGAQGIMYPRCDDAAEAKEVVRWAKFAPLGERGIDGGNPDNPFCAMPWDEYVRRANEETFIVIQLEHARAVENAESIAAVEGVDVLMLGPADFTALSGVPGQWDHPIVADAIKKISAAARNTGKHWGLPMSVEKAAEYKELGARVFFSGADIITLRFALEEMERKWAPLGVKFEIDSRENNQWPVVSGRWSDQKLAASQVTRPTLAFTVHRPPTPDH